MIAKDNERKFIFTYCETKLYKRYNESLNILLRFDRGWPGGQNGRTIRSNVNVNLGE